MLDRESLVRAPRHRPRRRHQGVRCLRLRLRGGTHYRISICVEERRGAARVFYTKHTVGQQHDNNNIQQQQTTTTYNNISTLISAVVRPRELTPEHQLAAHHRFSPKNAAGAVEDTSGRAVITFGGVRKIPPLPPHLISPLSDLTLISFLIWCAPIESP